jgi:DNA-binding NarL/FixJ family response regulator
VDKIRVLLANHHLMVPDDIRRLVEDQEDIELVGDCRGPMKILQEVGRTKADAVILVQEGTDEPGLCSQLLSVYPDVTILCFRAEKAAFTRQLCSQRRDFIDVENENIVQTLRTIVRERWRGPEI